MVVLGLDSVAAYDDTKKGNGLGLCDLTRNLVGIAHSVGSFPNGIEISQRRGYDPQR